MKILHTADWHLNDRLGRVDRTDDLKARVERIAELALEHQADLLLVAGDLFSEHASWDQMTSSLKHLQATFADFFARGGTILAVTGNHDRDGRIEAIRAGMALAAPPVQPGGTLLPGRMYLLNRPYFGKLRDQASGHDVQMVLVPFPTTSRYLDSSNRFMSKAEENRLLQAKVAEWLRKVPGLSTFDPALRTVLVAHLYVRGSQLRTQHHASDADNLIFDEGLFPLGWDYIALGDIHTPQAINGMQHVRYPGSLDRLDFGEKDEQHRGVLFVDLGPDGRRGDPVWLPIEPTPMYEVSLIDPLAEIPLLRERHPDADRALVKVSFRHRPEFGSRDEIVRRVREVFPRATEIFPEVGDADAVPHAARAVNLKSDFRSTVCEYLEKRLADDPDRDAVLQLAASILAEELAS